MCEPDLPVPANQDPEKLSLEAVLDCQFRGLEITTGSRRINEYKMLPDNVEMFGLKPEGLANVKEACLFPRDRRRVKP